MAIKDEFELHHVKNMAYFSKFWQIFSCCINEISRKIADKNFE